MSPTEYSLVALAIAFSTYYTLITAEPVTLAFQRYPGDQNNRGTYGYALSRASGALVVVGLIGIAIAIAFGQWRAALAIVGWGIGLAVVRLVSTAWLMWAIPWKYAANLMVSTGLRTFGLVALVLVGVDAAIAVAVAGVASAVGTLALSPRVRRAEAIRKAPWTWQFGAHLALASLAVTILTSSGLVVLPLFVSGSDIGRFAAMTQLATLTCGAILGLLLTVAYPALRALWDSGDVQRVSERLALLSEVCIATGLATVFVFSAGGYWVPNLVVGPQFVDAAILPALVLSAALASMGQLSGWFHQFQFKAAVVSRRTWISAGIGLAAIVAGAATLGTTGVALGGMVGFLAYYLILRWQTRLAPVLTAVTIALAASCFAVALVGETADIVVSVLSALGTIAFSLRIVWRLRARRN